jgi:hypothetical protein
LVKSFQTAGLLDQSAHKALRDRVDIVCGDLSKQNLGLTKTQWALVADETDRIIHNAATVDYALNYGQMRAVNVGGTRALAHSINILLSKLLEALPEDLDDAGGVQLSIFNLNSNVLSRAVYESEVRTAVPRVEDEEL